VLLPGADARAAELLSRLPQPFTVSQARRALDTTRRVAVPLLEHLDRAGLTERLDEVHRRCT
jgi:selenocysteine-specific elongation factor